MGSYLVDTLPLHQGKKLLGQHLYLHTFLDELKDGVVVDYGFARNGREGLVADACCLNLVHAGYLVSNRFVGND